MAERIWAFAAYWLIGAGIAWIAIWMGRIWGYLSDISENTRQIAKNTKRGFK